MENLEQKDLVVLKKNFRLQGKNFFLTYPKCTLTRDEVLALLLAKVPDAEYVLIASELHQDLTPHIHVFIKLKTKLRISSSTYFDVNTFHGNYQTARDPDDVIAYLNKSDKSPLSHGVYKSYNSVRGDTQSEQARIKRSEQNALILTTPLDTLVLNGDISIYSVDALCKSISRYRMETQTVPKYMPKSCIWIYGTPGIGKSRYVREKFPNVFLKAQNKWWDGYKQQTVVLLDDFDLHGECLGHYLKIWGDCYPFNAEVKGGTCQPVYDAFFITSNYLPSEIFCKGNDSSKHDPSIVEAIQRRFTIMTIFEGELIEYLI